MNNRQLMIDASRFRDAKERRTFWSDLAITIVCGSVAAVFFTLI